MNVLPAAEVECPRVLALPDLEQYAADYECQEADLPIQFSSEPYTRIVLHRDELIEVVLICFAAGQTSSVHHHRGSNCVIRLVRGKVMETLFEEATGDTLEYAHHHYLTPGAVSGLDGEQIHQLSNIDNSGSVLLNFYSPPFQI